MTLQNLFFDRIGHEMFMVFWPPQIGPMVVFLVDMIVHLLFDQIGKILYNHIQNIETWRELVAKLNNSIEQDRLGKAEENKSAEYWKLG